MLKAAALSAEALAGVLAQSVDCVKLLGLDGGVLWMNANGLCAMEIDDFSMARGRPWQELWPEPARALITDALPAASAGEIVRFDAFCPTAKGSPRWWNVTVSSVAGPDGEQVGYLAVSRDVTEAEAGRQALLIAAAEMRHRLRNTYAMIGSLLNGFAKGEEARERFAKEMQTRLIALSTAQELFSSDDVPCDISMLIPALVEPFATPACKIAMTDIVQISVAKGQADAIALVLGELAVNSAKHGALCKGGTIDVVAREEAGRLSINWKERSQVAIKAQTREGGQGLKLMDRIVKARQGSITIDWRQQGLTVSLGFPIIDDRKLGAASG